MTNTPVIAVLPVGEFDADSQKSEFEAIIKVVNGIGTELVIADPIGD